MSRNQRRVLAAALFLLISTAARPAPAVEEPQPPADLKAPPATAAVTASGLASVVLEEGSGGRHPGARDWVRVHYSGWTRDGELFDSSVRRGASLTAPVDRVIDGWTEGLQLMVEGEKRRFWIPQKLAYKGQPDRPRGTLVFDIELLEIVDSPEAPADVAAPPADAEVHNKKGLASKLLQAGHGDRRPRSRSTVTVHYTGWTTDGEMFDTTVLSGKPATFQLTGVIQGWRDGLQLMVEGEKRRFWIPEKLAYRGAKGKPQGMLVFDVELITINAQ